MSENIVSADYIEKNKVNQTYKYVYLPYHVYIAAPGTLGTDGTCIFESVSFTKISLQNLNPDKSSCKLPAANVDLVGVFKVVFALVLFEEGAEALL